MTSDSVLHLHDLPAPVLAQLRHGSVIPAHPLALDAAGTFDRLSQRALSRYYIDAGAGGLAVGVHTTQFAIREVGRTMGSGSLVGEIGLFTADRKRTATIICETDCVMYTMTDEAIHLLYFQNPKLGFYLVRLIVQRLLADLSRQPEVANA